MKRRTYQVKELAKLAGVSVRTLHHYDEIGLLCPTARSKARYRLYDEAALLRLQQILLGRAMGLSLESIRRSLDDPRFDQKKALLRQRKELTQKVTETRTLLRMVEHALSVLDGEGEAMEDMTKLFDGFDPKMFEAEAGQRWGGTHSHEESKRRTKRYKKEDWAALKREQAAIYDDMAALMQAGQRADGEEAMDVAERARLCIDRWFYPCSPAMHASLADLYETDARFAANIDKHGAALTPFLSAAIRANARRAA